jgi:hypothetical protein
MNDEKTLHSTTSLKGVSVNLILGAWRIRSLQGDWKLQTGVVLLTQRKPSKSGFVRLPYGVD